MEGQPGLYSPSHVYCPPELPNSFKHVYELKPIVGVPRDEEVIAIHAVIHAASRVAGVPGMDDPELYMKLADHLFDVQMARYRSKSSFTTFPGDTTYTPPALPAHFSVDLEPVSGAPLDEEIIKVQGAIQSYQELRRIPSLFDAQVNMQLSQHLFDLQMARHMRAASESRANPTSQNASGLGNTAKTTHYTQRTAGDSIHPTSSSISGTNTADARRVSQSAPGVDVHELLKRSNQLAERFNQLLERSNELMEQHSQSSTNQFNSQTLIERLNHVLERLTLLVEQSHRPTVGSDRLGERFNSLFERFNHLVEQSRGPALRANELAERSNELADRGNQLAETFGDLFRNINRVLVGIQHAIVRNHRGNTVNAIDCLVNEKGEKPGLMDPSNRSTMKRLSETFKYQPRHNCPVTVNGVSQYCCIPDIWLGDFIGFYGIGEGVCENATSSSVIPGKEELARTRLSDYLTSCLG